MTVFLKPSCWQIKLSLSNDPSGTASIRAGKTEQDLAACGGVILRFGEGAVGIAPDAKAGSLAARVGRIDTAN